MTDVPDPFTLSVVDMTTDAMPSTAYRITVTSFGAIENWQLHAIDEPLTPVVGARVHPISPEPPGGCVSRGLSS